MILTGDFETANAKINIENGYTFVWLWDLCTVDDNFIHYTGNTLPEFFSMLKEIGPSKIYFHNLGFDGSFIIDYLLKNGYTHTTTRKLTKNQFSSLITVDNLFYQIRICIENEKGTHIVELRDSAKKIPGTVEDIAKSYDLPILKGSIDYEMDRTNYISTPEDIAYIHNDTEIIARVLLYMYNDNMTHLTSASDSFNAYKQCIKVFESIFPVLDLKIDDYIRKSYRGGVVICQEPFANKLLNDIYVYDVNSMYPAKMCDSLLPYGQPVYYKGQYVEDKIHCIYIQRVNVCMKVKEKHLPTILETNFLFASKKYITDTGNNMVELTLTSVDLQLMLKHYVIFDIEYLDGYKFKASPNLFRKYILPLYEEKCNSEGAKKQSAKNKINSLYGKFASNPRHQNKLPYVEDNVVNYENDDVEITESVYTPVASFITAYAREYLITSAQNNYDIFVYCDTDSIHLTKSADNIEIHDNKLGAFKLEKIYEKAKYLCQKRYIGIKGDKLDVKCAGCTKAVKKQMNFNNFVFGSVFEGNLKYKTVQGGRLLVSTTFELKKQG